MPEATLSTVPLMNRLLAIVQAEASKGGHDIQSFSKKNRQGEPVYTGVCVTCGADAVIICTASKYTRTGSAFGQPCKVAL